MPQPLSEGSETISLEAARPERRAASRAAASTTTSKRLAFGLLGDKHVGPVRTANIRLDDRGT